MQVLWPPLERGFCAVLLSKSQCDQWRDGQFEGLPTDRHQIPPTCWHLALGNLLRRHRQPLVM